MNSTCDPELAARYVAGKLAAAELTQFELHLLGCDECQANVREAAMVRSALRVQHRRIRYAVAGVPAALAAAAVIAWLLWAPTQLQRLGQVANAPGLAPMQVRAAEDSAANFAERGIAAYQQRDFRAAARWLQRAETTDPQPGAAFFLGAAQLMAHQPAAAVAAFHRVLQSNESAYRDEALYYAAKAWLQLGNRDSALTDLRQSHLPAARALADSVALPR
jgi:tetratricopeptide (TPR) repeat protein